MMRTNSFSKITLGPSLALIRGVRSVSERELIAQDRQKTLDQICECSGHEILYDPAPEDGPYKLEIDKKSGALLFTLRNMDNVQVGVVSIDARPFVESADKEIDYLRYRSTNLKQPKRFPSLAQYFDRERAGLHGRSAKHLKSALAQGGLDIDNNTAKNLFAVFLILLPKRNKSVQDLVVPPRAQASEPWAFNRK